MAHDPHHPHTHGPLPERREVIVTGGHRGPGLLVGLIVGIVLAVLLAWFLVSYFGGRSRTVDVEVPDRVQIDINQR